MNGQGWTGVVLAGGRSSRMGRDKALMELDGRSLLDRALDVLDPHVQELLVIGDPERYGHVGPFVFADDIPGTGPLGGIITAMRYSSNDKLLVLACDMPGVNGALFERLKAGLAPAAAAFVPACDGEVQPLAAAYHRRCQGRFESLVAQGRWKVREALAEVDALYIQICPGEDGWPADLFRNINAPTDL
jgi:molybdopterin-guanine dinucleotide biosynthesis protein A